MTIKCIKEHHDFLYLPKDLFPDSSYNCRDRPRTIIIPGACARNSEPGVYKGKPWVPVGYFPSQSLRKLPRVESNTKMMASSLYLFLVLGIAFANQYCNDEYDESQVFGLGYSRLFSYMEKALLNQSVFLDRLKYGFMTLKETELYFNVQVKVVNGTNEYCPGDHGYEKAFCFSNSVEYNWELCSSLDMTYRLEYDPTFEPVEWLSVVHGNLLLITVFFAIIEDAPAEEYFSLTLEVEKLDCHPSLSLMKCVSSELFSWVSPHTCILHLISNF